MGRPFAAILKLSPDHKLEFDFGQSDRDDEALAEAVDFSGRSALGPCPKCGSSVYEHGMSYVCERSMGAVRSCDFRSGKIILQQEVGESQMRKLLSDGRTDLLDGFISARTRRKFKAFLVRGPDGKIGFEFAPRPAKPGAETAPKKAAGKAAANTPAAESATATPEKAPKPASSKPRKRPSR
jgi:DNA topoisomerase-3